MEELSRRLDGVVRLDDPRTNLAVIPARRVAIDYCLVKRNLPASCKQAHGIGELQLNRTSRLC